MENQRGNLFELLRSKDIIAILDGDTVFEEHQMEDGRMLKLALPYLSGPDICGLSNLFGYPMKYAADGISMSRWQYFDELLDSCIKDNRCSELLHYIFSKRQFSKRLVGLDKEEGERIYSETIEKALIQINSLLRFGNNELAIVVNSFVVRPIGTRLPLETPKIKEIDREYIISISNRAMQDVEQGNYDSAITKSRTLLEETFCYVIEKKRSRPTTTGEIGVLYKQVKDLYTMHGDPSAARCVNMLLSGLEKIVSATAEMRNKDSDAHGVGSNRVELDEHHARLFVNTSMSMAEFILSIANNENPKEELEK